MKYASALVAFSGLALCAASSLAASESRGSEGTAQGADALQSGGVKVTATFPIFHQIVAFSFPKGFVPSYEGTRDSNYIQESVLVGETVERWTQMITVTGRQALATNPQATSDRVADSITSGYRRACPGTFSGVRIPSEDLAQYSASVVVVGCGSVQGPGGPHSEAMLLVTLRGDEDYYTIQWAERGPASATALNVDTKAWVSRYQQLRPFRVCPRVPGEAPPFPSCISASGG